ncbi:hypothetical protein BgAZ_502210 [Babesia gibsoni]|uniref:Uncharacterized protein n=1 Tax=Babesia gibsoni TaxID=33632 RepID=A0AAD8PCV3_BABGI|nr:hypothetical protein BgAZ_502210 [Babesia gibsoni]
MKGTVFAASLFLAILPLISEASVDIETYALPGFKIADQQYGFPGTIYYGRLVRFSTLMPELRVKHTEMSDEALAEAIGLRIRRKAHTVIFRLNDILKDRVEFFAFNSLLKLSGSVAIVAIPPPDRIIPGAPGDGCTEAPMLLPGSAENHAVCDHDPSVFHQSTMNLFNDYLIKRPTKGLVAVVEEDQSVLDLMERCSEVKGLLGTMVRYRTKSTNHKRVSVYSSFNIHGTLVGLHDTVESEAQEGRETEVQPEGEPEAQEEQEEGEDEVQQDEEQEEGEVEELEEDETEAQQDEEPDEEEDEGEVQQDEEPEEEEPEEEEPEEEEPEEEEPEEEEPEEEEPEAQEEQEEGEGEVQQEEPVVQPEAKAVKPKVVLCATFESFSMLQTYRTSASNNSGLIALLEIANLLSVVDHGNYDVVVLLTSGTLINYHGATVFANTYPEIDHVKLVVCLDDLASPELYVHESSKATEISELFQNYLSPSVTETLRRGVNVKAKVMYYPHEQFTRQKVHSITITSSKELTPMPVRQRAFEYTCDADVLAKHIVSIAQSLAKALQGSEITINEEELRSRIETWENVLSTPRCSLTKDLHKDGSVHEILRYVKSLTKENIVSQKVSRKIQGFEFYSNGPMTTMFFTNRTSLYHLLIFCAAYIYIFLMWSLIRGSPKAVYNDVARMVFEATSRHKREMAISKTKEKSLSKHKIT